MSYGAYGGRAYRNGVMVPDRSDVAFIASRPVQPRWWHQHQGTHELEPFALRLVGYPGYYPEACVEECAPGTFYDQAHVVVGDEGQGLVVGLYKGVVSPVVDLRTGEEIPETAIPNLSAVDAEIVLATPYGEVTAVLGAATLPSGHRVDLASWHDAALANYFSAVMLTQPDGTVWLGWCGFEVGAGHDGLTGDDGHDGSAEGTPLGEHRAASERVHRIAAWLFELDAAWLFSTVHCAHSEDLAHTHGNYGRH